MADGCIFCRIAGKDISSEIVYEDDHVVSFLDINPISPGHTVVVPKKHFSTIFDLADGDVAGLFVAVRNTMKAIEAGLKPAGFNYGANHGRVAGQAIDHLHIHILPRFENDGGGSMHSIVRNPPKQQSLEEVAGLIRGAGGFKQVEKKEEVPAAKEEKKEEDIGKKLKELEEELAKHTKTFLRMKRP